MFIGAFIIKLTLMITNKQKRVTKVKSKSTRRGVKYKKQDKKSNTWRNQLTHARIYIFVFIFGIVGSILLFRSFAATPNATEKMGVHRGSETPDKVAEYEKWLGRPVTYTVDFIGKANPVDDPWKNIDNPASRCRAWNSTKYKLSLSTGMIPSSSYSLEAGARGDYNSHWKKFGQVMVAEGCSDLILRLGWEFNGKFYNWSAGGKEASFAAYWRQIVNTLRTVPGQAFTYDWCPLAGNTNANVEAAYPGDAYVDIIGLDAYDTSSVQSSSADRWNNQVTRTYGLKWQKDFAMSHGKQVSYPEWGLTVRPKDNLGGGDNPYYIQKMYDWMNDLPSSGPGSLVYHSYFEVNASDAAHRLMPVDGTLQFPSSSALFKKLFGVLPTSDGGTSDTTNPSTPTGLVGSAPGSSQVNLVWKASTDNIGVSGYDIYRNGSKVGSASSPSFNNSGLSASTTYQYYVVATDAVGNVSSPSTTVSVTTPASSSGSSSSTISTLTTSFNSTLNNYGNKTYSITLPKAGAIEYSVTSSKPKGKFDVTVYNSSGSVISKVENTLVPIKRTFTLQNAGTININIKSEWRSYLPFTLKVTYPN